MPWVWSFVSFLNSTTCNAMLTPGCGWEVMHFMSFSLLFGRLLRTWEHDRHVGLMPFHDGLSSAGNVGLDLLLLDQLRLVLLSICLEP